ncbi:MAG TPA: hypothetical protein VIC35_07035 [Acidimicrobiia bacterium]
MRRGRNPQESTTIRGRARRRVPLIVGVAAATAMAGAPALGVTTADAAGSTRAAVQATVNDPTSPYNITELPACAAGVAPTQPVNVGSVGSATVVAWGADGGGDDDSGDDGGAGGLAAAAVSVAPNSTLLLKGSCAGVQANGSPFTTGVAGGAGAAKGGGSGNEFGTPADLGGGGGGGGGASSVSVAGKLLVTGGGGGGVGGGDSGGQGGDASLPGIRGGFDCDGGNPGGTGSGVNGGHGGAGANGGLAGTSGGSGGAGGTGGAGLSSGGGGGGGYGGGGGGGGSGISSGSGIDGGGGGGGSSFAVQGGRTYTQGYNGPCTGDFESGDGFGADGYAAVFTMKGTLGGGYWPHRDIVRGVAAYVGSGGWTLDAYGGLHAFKQVGGNAPPMVFGGAYWSGHDMARSIAVLPNGSGGWIMDLYGGLHWFSIGAAKAAPMITGGGYWPGRDIARGISILPDGSGGYLLDYVGGLHAFGINGSPPPPLTGPAFKTDTARGVTVTSRTGGYVIDAFGVIRLFGKDLAFQTTPAWIAGAPAWPGVKIARGMALYPDGAGGFVVDGYGGLHPISSVTDEVSGLSNPNAD